MSGSQFWRLFWLVNVIAVSIAGCLVYRAFDEVYAYREYAYDPWTAVILGEGLSLDTVERLSVKEVTTSNQAYVFQNYLRYGYRACPLGSDEYLQACFDREVGFGKLGIMYPADGSIENLSSMTFPALGKSARGNARIVKAPAYVASGNNERVHDAIGRITELAVAEYQQQVSREISDRAILWLIVGVGPGVLMLLLLAAYRWVRFGALKGAGTLERDSLKVISQKETL